MRRVLANWEILNNLYSPELTATSLAKFTISPVGFVHSLGVRIARITKIIERKLNFSARILYLVPTCQEKLMEEFSADYFLDKN